MLVKCKIKEYPDGTRIALEYPNEYVKGEEVGQRGTGSMTEKSLEEMEQEKNHSAYMNLIRTKNQVKDYCLSNDFSMFWTLTFGKDREDDEKCFNRMSNWLKHMKKKYGRFDYIFIPERHKDGCIHFHGVTGRFMGQFVDSGKREKGNVIYNCANWKFGFSTVTKIRDSKKTASYITKYVTKDLSQNIVGKGKKKYWNSRGLRKPVESYYDYIPFTGYEPVFENENVKIYNLGNGQLDSTPL